METKDAAVRDELYEEAQLLRRRQQDYKTELVGLPGTGGCCLLIMVEVLSVCCLCNGGAGVGCALVVFEG